MEEYSECAECYYDCKGNYFDKITATTIYPTQTMCSEDGFFPPFTG